MGRTLREAVINSGRWKKWVLHGEEAYDFNSISPERKDWLVMTCCRYIWEGREVKEARRQLYENLESHSVHAEEIVLIRIESAMDKYFEAFNLKGLNTLL